MFSSSIFTIACFLGVISHADTTQSVTFGKLRREYIAHDGGHGANKAPLVVLLHGWTSDARSILDATKFRDAADSFGMIVVAPEGLNAGWNAGFMDLSGKAADDVGFLSAVIDDASKKFAVDSERVYVVGHSNGAMLANTYGAKCCTRVAAIVSVSGTIGVRSDSGKLRQVGAPVGRTNVLLIHGMKDPMVAYSETSSSLLRGVGAVEAAKRWADWLMIHTGPKVTELPRIGREDSYQGQGVEVRLVSLNNGFHNWPGGVSNGRRETKSGFDATAYICRWLLTKTRVPR